MSVYKIRYGTPEEIVPTKFAPAPKCDIIEGMPEGAEKMIFSTSRRGVEVLIPVDADAGIYGFGLQLKRVHHRG